MDGSWLSDLDKFTVLDTCGWSTGRVHGAAGVGVVPRWDASGSAATLTGFTSNMMHKPIDVMTTPAGGVFMAFTSPISPGLGWGWWEGRDFEGIDNLIE